MAGAVDLEIDWSSGVMELLVARHGIGTGDLDRDHRIESERDLVTVILSFLADGAGGERHVVSSAASSNSSRRSSTHALALGGTPVRAGLALHSLGVPCLLHLVAVDVDVRRLLPASCTYITSAHEDSTHPHLIVQFPEGACVRVGDTDVCASRPNRLIFTHDPPAEELRISDQLGTALADARIFLVSSLNAIRDGGVLEARLSQLRRYMERLPSDAFVYYEDAGFHDPALSKQAADGLRGAVDVHGMNEDEAQVHLGHEVDLLDADEMAEALAELSSLVAGPTVVLHSGAGCSRWEPAPSATSRRCAAVIAMATSRYLHGDALGPADSVALQPIDPTGVGFARELRDRLGDRVCCIPVGHGDDPASPTTIGLGDTFVGGFPRPRSSEPVPSRRRRHGSP